MIGEICKELNNFFIREIRHGSFSVKDGRIEPLDFLQEGQYYRIVGSVFNDGVHQYSSEELTDEIFDGAIWAMAVPPSVIALCAEIEAWNGSDAAKPSPYTSESFGGYSYARATDINGAPLTWQGAFKSRLNKYRRVNVL